jgi:hypothetical protein
MVHVTLAPADQATVVATPVRVPALAAQDSG